MNNQTPVLMLWIPTLALILPMAYFSAHAVRRQKSHPVQYMWFARAFCVMPLLAMSGIVFAALYHYHLTGFEAGLQTGINGGVCLLIVYAVLFACGREEIAHVIKSAHWKRET